jgi:hypothetical protein
MRSAGRPEEDPAHRVVSDATASLFVRLVSRSPELLEGRWRILYARVRLDGGFWSYPRQTLDDVELGGPGEPVLDEVQVQRRWPELVAAAFRS